MVYDGLWQGYCEASVVFSLAIWRTVVAALQKLRAEGVPAHAPMYIDDTLVFVQPQQTARLRAVLGAELAAAHLRLKPPKCCGSFLAHVLAPRVECMQSPRVPARAAAAASRSDATAGTRPGTCKHVSDGNLNIQTREAS